ncbi:MAG TPA: amidohydrolase family protein [Pyrinomonadaceae bacterium]|jgi:predicted TIM-barrel fold metal-dependent hydrolase
MAGWTRRNWLASLGVAAAGQGIIVNASQVRPKERELGREKAPGKGKLALEDYEPKSMLHVPETKVSRARFPVIDFHTHLSWSARRAQVTEADNNATPEEVLSVMDRKNLRMMVNLTGGYGKVLEQTINYWQKPHPDRFVVFTEPWFEKITEPGYPQFQADQIARAQEFGARGLKVLKTLGLYLRERVRTGPLVKIDDHRFDPMWEAAGAHRMPVAIHTSDPEAFFLPTDRFNERYEELSAHPDWSFYGKDFPSNQELQEARNRLMARHPRTQFVVLHVGDSENLPFVSELLDRYPNMHVEIGARIGELGRQPRASRKFFDKYQDRILFGTDAVPRGNETPQQIFGERLYEIYYRFLETEDEYFDYAPAPKPPQGRWRIYGIGLPERILRKVYYENAERLLGLKS